MSRISSTEFKNNASFMNDFRFAFFWMPTNLAYKFDEWLRLPIRDHKGYTDSSRQYFEYLQGIPPEESEDLGHARFEELLCELEGAGEDINRLVLWFASISEGHESLGMKPRAADLWMSTVERWAREETLELHFEIAGLDKRFSNEYRTQVFENLKYIYSETKVLSKSWHSNPMNFSEFDEYVNTIYYSLLSGGGGDPAEFFYSFIERQLNREWWRITIALLSEAQIINLHNELINSLSSVNTSRQIKWDNATRLDRAFAFELIPDFKTVARDW